MYETEWNAYWNEMIISIPGLTYWRLNENELYRPLPDSFDSGAYLLLQEASMSLVSRTTVTGVNGEVAPQFVRNVWWTCIACIVQYDLGINKEL